MSTRRMNLLPRRGKGEPVFEQIIADRINAFYLLERKSFEVQDRSRHIPIVATPEVIDIANQYLRTNGIDTAINDETTGWDIFWARELAAAMSMSASGRRYPNYLPGRTLHYESLAKSVDSLLNGRKDGKVEIAELGAGSGLGLMILAKMGAYVTHLDTSK